MRVGRRDEKGVGGFVFLVVGVHEGIRGDERGEEERVQADRRVAGRREEEERLRVGKRRLRVQRGGVDSGGGEHDRVRLEVLRVVGGRREEVRREDEGAQTLVFVVR